MLVSAYGRGRHMPAAPVRSKRLPWHRPYTPAQNQRLEQALYATPGQVVFVTVRAYAKSTPFTEAALNSAVVAALAQEQADAGCAVFTYCLMRNHLHFLAAPVDDGASVLEFTRRFKGRATNASWRLGRSGKLWQPRYYDHVPRREESLAASAAYILANPMRKGYVAADEEWPWSGHLNLLPL